MRYSKIDLQCEDLTWFGYDKNGFVFCCNSSGYGSIPEFVAQSQEKTEELLDYFLEQAQEFCSYSLLIEHKQNPLIEDSIHLSKCGITCFDIFFENPHKYEYQKISVPSEYLNINSLEDRIRNLLVNHFVDIDITKTTFFTTEHAY